MDRSGRPVALDTSIGTLKLYSTVSEFSPESGITDSHTEVETEEIDFIKTNDTTSWFNNTPTRGVLKAKDYNQLPLQGIMADFNKKYINITFIQC